jgi:hypothetical protein
MPQTLLHYSLVILLLRLCSLGKELQLLHLKGGAFSNIFLFDPGKKSTWLVMSTVFLFRSAYALEVWSIGLRYWNIGFTGSVCGLCHNRGYELGNPGILMPISAFLLLHVFITTSILDF